MSQHKQNLKAFPVPENDQFVAVVRGPEWVHGQWSCTETVVVFAPADRPLGADHNLIAGPRYRLSQLLGCTSHLPLLSGERLDALSVTSLAFRIEDWVRGVYASRHDEVVHT